MTNCLSLINGKFQDSVSVLDRGLAYGDGFFETMFWTLKDEGGVVERFGVEFWNEHLNRIKKGCELLKIKFPKEKNILHQREKILRKFYSSGVKSGVLKMIITRGVGGRGYKFQEKMDQYLNEYHIFLKHHKFYECIEVEILNYKHHMVMYY